MNLPTKFIALQLFAASILFSACGSQPSGNTATPANANANSTANTNATKDDPEELRTLIQVPFEPEEVTWRVTGSDKKKLVAVFVMTPEAHKVFESKLGATGSGQDVQVAVEQWFPAELTSMSEMGGESSIPGKAFPATDFFQSPFEAGNVVFIAQTDYVVLELN